MKGYNKQRMKYIVKFSFSSNRGVMVTGQEERSSLRKAAVRIKELCEMKAEYAFVEVRK